MPRRPRAFSDLAKRQLLDSLRPARRDCTLALSKAPIYGDEYQAILKVMEAMDDLAQVLTGDRERLWQRTANTTWPQAPGKEKPRG
jgi:hypothetical protein